MKFNLYKIILQVGLILSSIQWIKTTIVFMALSKINRMEIIPLLDQYYLVMLIVMVCSGFLLKGEKE